MEGGGSGGDQALLELPSAFKLYNQKTLYFEKRPAGLTLGFEIRYQTYVFPVRGLDRNPRKLVRGLNRNPRKLVRGLNRNFRKLVRGMDGTLENWCADWPGTLENWCAD